MGSQNAYGYGYEVNSGWKGYNKIYQLDDTADNLLRLDHNAQPCCAQKRPSAFPVAWPPKDTYLDPIPRATDQTRLLGVKNRPTYQEKLPPFASAKLFYVAIAILVMVVIMKLAL